MAFVLPVDVCVFVLILLTGSVMVLHKLFQGLVNHWSVCYVSGKFPGNSGVEVRNAGLLWMWMLSAQDLALLKRFFIYIVDYVWSEFFTISFIILVLLLNCFVFIKRKDNQIRWWWLFIWFNIVFCDILTQRLATVYCCIIVILKYITFWSYHPLQSILNTDTVIIFTQSVFSSGNSLL